jgi:hypothetical protein
MAAGENHWRKEFIQRTCLLRSFGKLKVQLPGITNKHPIGAILITYAARAGPSSISHMAATFGQNAVRCVHASLEAQILTASNATTGMLYLSFQSLLNPCTNTRVAGKIEKRPSQQDTFAWFANMPNLRELRDNHPDFEIANDMNVNCVMDVSEEMGWIMGENSLEGRCYVHPHPSPYVTQDAMFIGPGNNLQHGFRPAVTAVWIAKKRSGGVYDTTGAAVIIANSRGVVRVFTIIFQLGRRILSEIQSYCVCPGVPILQIKVDEDFTPSRVKQKKPWVAMINAVGEVYYLLEVPSLAKSDCWRLITSTSRAPTAYYNAEFPDLTEKPAPGQVIQQNPNLHDMDYSKIKNLWDRFRMDWFVEVDWAGDNIITGVTGSESYWHGTLVQPANIEMRRYHRLERTCRVPSEPTTGDSIIDGVLDSSPADIADPTANIKFEDEWTPVNLGIHDPLFTRITAHSLDNSNIARVSSECETLPGENSQLFAIGTNTGSIFVFNIRPTLGTASIHYPIRTIHTLSPQITTLAISSLVVVHGGDDGLVQAWNVLGSSEFPVRTLHSGFSARTRHRIGQTGAVSTNNQYAARCLAIDPDASRLRGVVALGTRIRSWSFSATVCGLSGKGRRKKNGGGGNHAGDNPRNATSHRSKDAAREVIQADELALQLERDRQYRKAILLEKRYGIGSGSGALNDEEMLAYASMISAESFAMQRKGNSSSTPTIPTCNDSIPNEGSPSKITSHPESDLERALRESLKDVQTSDMAARASGEEMRTDKSMLLSFEAISSLSSSQIVPPSSSSTPAWSTKVLNDSEEEWPNNVTIKSKKLKGKKLGNGKGKGKQQQGDLEMLKRTSVGDENALEDDDLGLAIKLSLEEWEKETAKRAEYWKGKEKEGEECYIRDLE